MKKGNMYRIIDEISGDVCCTVRTGNGKQALKNFRNGLLSSGFYWIEKQGKDWKLISSYGSSFVAVKTI